MTDTVTVAIGCDHAAIDLKNQLKAKLEEKGVRVLDAGTHNADSVDYPDIAAQVCEHVQDGDAAWGVLICGSGIGMSMAANRYYGIRAALCHDVTSARLCRQHNNANILVLGARLTGVAVALDCLEAFAATPFEGGRHLKRVEKIDSLTHTVKV